jgi:hypothetical protein
MITTAPELQDLLVGVNDATKLLRRSKTVPAEVAELIDSFGSLRLEADPYLTATLWAAAYGAEKALRHDNQDERRRDVRIALEQFRQALRDIVENRRYNDDVPIRDVLFRTAEVLAAPQKTLAELLGVSVR